MKKKEQEEKSKKDEEAAKRQEYLMKMMVQQNQIMLHVISKLLHKYVFLMLCLSFNQAGIVLQKMSAFILDSLLLYLFAFRY